MSAVAISSQQPPHTGSLNTPGFFSQAFLELNVFEQCFSSLQSSDATPPSSAPSSSLTSEKKRKAPVPSANFEQRSPIINRYPKDKPEITTPPNTEPSLPSPIMENQTYPLNLGNERRLSEQGLFNISQTVSGYIQDRRYSVPLTSWNTLCPSINTDTLFNPVSQPTPPISVNSDSCFNTPPEITLSNGPQSHQQISHPSGASSPLDGMIVNDTVMYTAPACGQATPPSDKSFADDLLESIELPAEESMSCERLETSLDPPEIKVTNPRAKRGVGKPPAVATARKQSASFKKATNSTEPLEDDKRRKKFLERNRVAASKCRQKKKLWMQRLEEEARQSAAQAKALREQVNTLKDEMLNLKGMLLKHTGCGCHQVQTYLENEAAKVAQAAQSSLDNLTAHEPPPEVSAPAEGSFAEGSMLGEDDSMLDDGFNFEEELAFREEFDGSGSTGSFE